MSFWKKFVPIVWVWNAIAGNNDAPAPPPPAPPPPPPEPPPPMPASRDATLVDSPSPVGNRRRQQYSPTAPPERRTMLTPSTQMNSLLGDNKTLLGG